MTLRPFKILPVIALLGCGIDSRTVTAPVTACKGIPVERALVTDFSDATEELDYVGNPGVRFGGGPIGRGGSTLTFNAEGLAPPRLSLTKTANDNPALQIDATPGMAMGLNFWLGFVLTFDHDSEACVDAHEYRGVSFTIAGTTSTCELMFQVEISPNYDVGLMAPNTACTLGPDRCYPPYSLAFPVNGPEPVSHRFPFTALSGGSPVDLVDPTTITNLSWKLYAPFEGPPCDAHLVLDDVTFFK